MFKRPLPFWIRIYSVIFIIILTCVGLPEDENVEKEGLECRTIDSYIWEIIGRSLLLVVAETTLNVKILSRFSNSCIWIRKLLIGSLSLLFAMHGTNTAVNSVLVIATQVIALLLLKILYTIVEVFVAILYEEVTKKKNRTGQSEPFVAKLGGSSYAIQPPQYVAPAVALPQYVPPKVAVPQYVPPKVAVPQYVAPKVAATPPPPPVAPASISPPVKNMGGPANNMPWNAGQENSTRFQMTGSISSLSSDSDSVRSDPSIPDEIADQYKKKFLKKVSMK